MFHEKRENTNELCEKIAEKQQTLNWFLNPKTK